MRKGRFHGGVARLNIAPGCILDGDVRERLVVAWGRPGTVRASCRISGEGPRPWREGHVDSDRPVAHRGGEGFVHAPRDELEDHVALLELVSKTSFGAERPSFQDGIRRAPVENVRQPVVPGRLSARGQEVIDEGGVRGVGVELRRDTRAWERRVVVDREARTVVVRFDGRVVPIEDLALECLGQSRGRHVHSR